MTLFEKLCVVVTLAVLVLCAPLSGRALAADGDFTARLVVTKGGNVNECMLHYTHDMQRYETTAPVESVTIVRQDAGVAWLLMPDHGSYIEMPSLPAGYASIVYDQGDIIDEEDLGKQDVFGRATEHKKVTVRYDNGDTATFFQWYSPELTWPVKIEALDGSWGVVYRSIDFGDQDPELFEVPEGYDPMEGMSTEGLQRLDEVPSDGSIMPGAPVPGGPGGGEGDWGRGG